LRIYHTLALMLMMLLSWAHWYGWSPSPTERLKGVPRSVRDNPGSYRSVYSHYTHYSGGK